MSLLRVYDVIELGRDGYPLAWHRGDPAIKDLVRELARHRCVRCQHPFVVGETEGEWSPCDERCDHAGPFRGWSAGKVTWWDEYENPRTARHYLIEQCYERLDAKWRVLTVHHLTGIKADCRWWNLAALCQRCHLQIQGRVRMAQVYPYEHSEWLKPYAAGYYAATYLGEDLDRKETEARLDELLALEQLHPAPEAA